MVDRDFVFLATRWIQTPAKPKDDIVLVTRQPNQGEAIDPTSSASFVTESSSSSSRSSLPAELPACPSLRCVSARKSRGRGSSGLRRLVVPTLGALLGVGGSNSPLDACKTIGSCH